MYLGIYNLSIISIRLFCSLCPLTPQMIIHLLKEDTTSFENECYEAKPLSFSLAKIKSQSGLEKTEKIHRRKKTKTNTPETKAKLGVLTSS